MNIWIISGKDPLTKQPLSIIYAGHDKNKNCVAELAFGSSYSEIHIGNTWIWNLVRIIRKRACSLIVLEVNKAFRRLFDSKKSFFIPCWVGGEVDIPEDISPFVKANSSLRSDMRRIRNNNLQIEVTSKQWLFDEFYNNMYFPHITRVHGNKNFLMTYHEMKEKSKIGKVSPERKSRIRQ